MNLSQSSLLVGLLALAFILYVAARGRLTTYTGVLWGKKSSDTSGGSGSNGGGGVTDALSTAFASADFAKYAEMALEFTG